MILHIEGVLSKTTVPYAIIHDYLASFKYVKWMILNLVIIIGLIKVPSGSDLSVANT